MLTRIAKTKVLVVILTLIAVFAAACAAEAPAPVPAAEIRSMMQEAVAGAAPATIDPKEIQSIVEAAVKAGPGVSKADLESAIKAQMGTQMTAADVKRVVDSAISAMPAPQIDIGAVRPLIEAAVAAAAPEGVSAAEIGRMVTAAVGAATKDVATRGELEASIAKSITDAAAGRLTADEVQKIVAASLVATEEAIEEATQAAKAADKAAQAAVIEAAAARTLAEGAPKAPDFRYIAKQQVAGRYFDFVYDGPRPTTFNESPALTRLVMSGALPPLEERIPVAADVLVVPLPDEVGAYGGTWRITNTRTSGPHAFGGLGVQANADGETFIPNVVKSWTLSDDKKVYTFKLREGARWSDGAPFTTEDWRFAWEDINLDPDLGPANAYLHDTDRAGTPLKLGVVDDYTFTMTFELPRASFLDGDNTLRSSIMAHFWSWYAPAHYLKPFHKKYADAKKLDEMVNAAEVEDWVALFRSRANFQLEEQVDAPFMGPWFMCEKTAFHSRMCRNPYYFGVDPEGNQLPYIDSIFTNVVESPEVSALRSMGGESDLVTGGVVTIGLLPVFIKNMEKGDYSLYHWPAWARDLALVFNQTYNDDPEIGRLIRTKEFRIALALGIDGTAMNETVFLGLGTTNQNYMAVRGTPYYPGDEWLNLDTKLDIPRANKMLDDLGLEDTDGDGFRNRIGDVTGDKGNLELFLEPRKEIMVAAAELLQEQWAKIGIKLDFKLNPRGASNVAANTSYMMLSTANRGGGDPPNPWYGPLTYGPGYANTHTGPLIGKCYVGRDDGMCKTDVDPSYLPLAPEGNYPADPTGVLAHMLDIWDEGASASQYDPKRIEIAQELFRIMAEEKFEISIIIGAGAGRGLVLKRNNFRNVPKTNSAPKSPGWWPMIYYFEDGIDNINHPGNKSTRYKSENLLGAGG